MSVKPTIEAALDLPRTLVGPGAFIDESDGYGAFSYFSNDDGRLQAK